MNHPDENLEYLLAEKQSHEPHAVDCIAEPVIAPLQADRSCDLPQFIELINTVIERTIKKSLNVDFVPDEGARPIVDATEDLTRPRICFSVINREPKLEKKPRLREERIETSGDTGSDRFISIWGQKFQCTLQFDIYASEYTTANKVMLAFEGLMSAYTSFFKKNGVVELLFQRHYTDHNYKIFRNQISVRSLCYYVEVERLTPIYEGEIFDIEIT